MSQMEVDIDPVKTLNWAKGMFKKSGSAKNSATGAMVGGLLGSIVPGIGNAIGAAVGGLIGAMIGGGIHDKTNTEKVIRDEIATRENDALEKFGMPKDDTAKLNAAVYLRGRFNDLVRHAELHGKNSIAKSSKQHHEARKKAFETLVKGLDKEIRVLSAKSNGTKSGWMLDKMRQHRKRVAESQGHQYNLPNAQGAATGTQGEKKPMKTSEKVGLGLSVVTGAATIINGISNLIKR